jgi:hypothetical protein
VADVRVSLCALSAAFCSIRKNVLAGHSAAHQTILIHKFNMKMSGSVVGVCSKWQSYRIAGIAPSRKYRFPGASAGFLL